MPVMIVTPMPTMAIATMKYEAPNERAGAHRLAFLACGLDTTVPAGRYRRRRCHRQRPPLTRWCLRRAAVPSSVSGHESLPAVAVLPRVAPAALPTPLVWRRGRPRPYPRAAGLAL